MNNPLLDKEFLKQLDLYNNKIIYARVFSLTRDELPVEEITGTVTDGSISIDGSSSVRRTCNLTMVAREADITDYYWTLKTKIKLEIGVQNDIDDRYPEIIWFPQGIYVLTSFSSSYATNNCTISLSGKDKMCLLNGELGGVFNSEIKLDEVDQEIINYETMIALNQEQFFAACEPVVIRYQHQLNFNKYSYFDFSEALTFQKIENTDMSSTRFNGQEVFAIKNEETNEYEIVKKYNSSKNVVYHKIIVNVKKIKNVTTFSSPCKLWRNKNLYIKWKDNYFLTNLVYDIQNIYQADKTLDFVWIEDQQFPSEDIKNRFEQSGLKPIPWEPYKYYYLQTDANNVLQSISLDGSSSPKIGTYAKIKDNYYIGKSDVQTIKLTIKQILKELLHEYGNEPYYNIILNDIPDKGKELLNYNKKEPLYILARRKNGLIYYSQENQQYGYNCDNFDNEISYLRLDKSFMGVNINDLYVSYLRKTNSENIYSSDYTYYKVTVKKPDDDNSSWYAGLYILNESGKFEALTESSKYNEYIDYYRQTETSYGGSSFDDKFKLKDILDENFRYEGKKEPNIFLLWKYVNFGWETIRDSQGEFYGEIIRIQQDKIAGYRSTDLTYPDELILSPGETVTAALDKIKNMLGNYEYFYDLDGRFVFQEKKTFLNTAFSQFYSGDDTEQFIDYTKDKYVYTFSNNEAVVSVARSPAVGNIKNDFTIWGEKKTASGSTVPIHMRYAIDEKPITYVSWTNSLKENQSEYPAKTYTTLPAPEVDKQKDTVYNCDWRELIYQMALDFRKFGTYDPLSENPIQDPDFNLTIRKLNPDLCDEKGLTGYEQYYIDLQGFWRILYNPFYSWENNENYNQEDYFINDDSSFQYWTQQLKEPENLIFWFDFLDTTGDLGKFSVKEIGHRAMAKTEDSVTAIKFRDTPPFIYTAGQEEDVEGTGFDFIQVTPEEMETMFSVSSQGTDAETWINDNIYKNALATETITLNTIPIYYLKPNALIDLITSDIYLNGEYIINKISYSLSHNGTMTISAIKNQPYIV